MCFFSELGRALPPNAKLRVSHTRPCGFNHICRPRAFSQKAGIETSKEQRTTNNNKSKNNKNKHKNRHTNNHENKHKSNRKNKSNTLNQ